MTEREALSMSANLQTSSAQSEQQSGQQSDAGSNGSAAVPECCKTCGYYKPKIWYLHGRDCAAFGSIAGVKHNRCGLWNPRSPNQP